MSKRKILVVEDELELREIMLSLLAEKDHDVVEAEDGVEGFRLLNQGEFSLVLSDIRMPTMSGLDLFAAAKEMNIQVPFVFITAFGDQENIVNALRLGAFDFIKKPFDDEEVHQVVDRALEVGFRRNQIMENIRRGGDDAMKRIERDEKFIRLLELYNFKKRA